MGIVKSKLMFVLGTLAYPPFVWLMNRSYFIITDRDTIVKNAQQLLDDIQAYQKMSTPANPFGDGKASQRILEILRQE